MNFLDQNVQDLEGVNKLKHGESPLAKLDDSRRNCVPGDEVRNREEEYLR